jgi:Mrp family chromosome partitioning ATPase
LPIFVNHVALRLSSNAIENAAFVRNVNGALFLVVDEVLTESFIAELKASVRSLLEVYADEEPVRDNRAFNAEGMLLEAQRQAPRSVAGHSIHYLDRRILGSDWLLPPKLDDPITQRIAFCSLKGGVGRSTALVVAAAHLSQRGRRVLAIDLDIEAPGIGFMLVERDLLPKFGTLDFLVESGLASVDKNFLLDLSVQSYLGAFGGRVTVIPAVGSETIENPSDALSKIARAYLENISADGQVSSLTDQIRQLVDLYANSGEYDVILIDSRAGMHEIAAPVLLGLGAEVLPNRSQTSDEPDEDLSVDDFDMQWVDLDELEPDVAEHAEIEVLRIYDDRRFAGFDPFKDRGLLRPEVFGATYGELTAWLDRLIFDAMAPE